MSDWSWKVKPPKTVKNYNLSDRQAYNKRTLDAVRGNVYEMVERHVRFDMLCPLGVREIEELLCDPRDSEELRRLARLAPSRFVRGKMYDTSQTICSEVRVPYSDEPAPVRLALNINVNINDRYNVPPDFIVSVLWLPTEAHGPANGMFMRDDAPPQLKDAMQAYLRKRLRAGTEAALVHEFIKAFVGICDHPRMLWASWPTLMDFLADDSHAGHYVRNAIRTERAIKAKPETAWGRAAKGHTPARVEELRSWVKHCDAFLARAVFLPTAATEIPTGAITSTVRFDGDVHAPRPWWATTNIQPR